MTSAAEWLLEQSNIELTPETLVEGLASALERDGLPILRISAWLPTQHPELWGSQMMWRRGGRCDRVRRPHDVYTTPTFQGTPGQAAYEGRVPVRCRLDVPAEELRFPMLAEVAAEGGIDYLIVPFSMAGGEAAWMSFATDRADGFSDADITRLEYLAPILSLHFQIFAERYAKQSLLEVYLGQNAARHVLAGAFHRGTGTLLRAAIWFCDLRGFTSLSDRVGAREVVAVLDRYFECVAGPIEHGGGEILKLIGDAALAVFPIGEEGPADPCRRALVAAETALANLEKVHATRPDWPPLAMGVALHLGDVLYGNIGGRSRLDFTAIGPAVNEVCRVESLCKTLGTPLLMTAAFADALAADDTICLGEHELRGVSAPGRLHTLARYAAS